MRNDTRHVLGVAVPGSWGRIRSQGVERCPEQRMRRWPPVQR